MSTVQVPFSNTNVSIVKLMISVTSDVSLWYTPVSLCWIMTMATNAKTDRSKRSTYPIKYWLKIIKAILSKSNLCETFGKDNKYIQLTGQPSFKNNQMSRLPAPATDILNQLKTKENLFCNAQISVYKRIPAERIFYCGKLNTSEAAVQNYSEAAFHDVL